MPVTSDKWIEVAAPQLPGAPLQSMQFEWVNAAREFFCRSTAWRDTLSPITISAAVDTYTLTSGLTDVSINQVHVASIPDRYLVPSSRHPEVFSDQTSNTPTQFSSPEPHIMRLWPMPDEEILDGLLVEVSLFPTSATAEMPDYIGDNFFDVLLAGMLGRMMNHPSKPYGDPTKAAYHLRRFRSGMARVRGNAIHGLNQSENSWVYPHFARGRMYL